MLPRQVSIDVSELLKYQVKIEVVDKDDPRKGAVRKVLIPKSDAIRKRDEFKEIIGALAEEAMLDVLDQVTPDR